MKGNKLKFIHPDKFTIEQAMEARRESRCIPVPIFNLGAGCSGWSTQHPGRFNPGHRVGDWVGKPRLYGDSIPRPPSPLLVGNIDWAIPARSNFSVLTYIILSHVHIVFTQMLQPPSSTSSLGCLTYQIGVGRNIKACIERRQPRLSRGLFLQLQSRIRNLINPLTPNIANL